MEIMVSLFSAAASVPTGTSGAGWVEWAVGPLVALVVTLVVICWQQRRAYNSLEATVIQRHVCIRKLEEQIAPEFSLRDTYKIKSSDGDGARVVLIEFTTVAGMQDFYRWVTQQSKRAKGVKK